MSEHVDPRLVDYERHRALPLPEDARVYNPPRARPTPSRSRSPRSLKVFAYGRALADNGRERVLERVGVEPSGDAFNSIVLDERHERPRNPMVNAGAVVTSSLVDGNGPQEKVARPAGRPSRLRRGCPAGG